MSDLARARSALTIAGFEMTSLSVRCSDLEDTVKLIVKMWDDMVAERPIIPADWFALMEKARRQVEDRR